MRLATRYWAHIAMWTGILFAILSIISLLSGQGVAAVVSNIPVWGGLALILSAFPAGLAASPQAIPEGDPQWRPLAEFALAAVAVSVLALVLAGYVGPAASRWLDREDPPATGVAAAAQMSLGEIRGELRSAVARARADSVTPPDVRWRRANDLAWSYYSRTDGSLVLPVLFGCLGVLMGFWSRLIPRADVRQAFTWAMGLFLVATTYLMGENSYELIVLQSAGYVDFAAGFRLVIPAMLTVGMGWPTVLTLWKRHRDAV
ncbi:MAG: hypothetical protein O7I93_05750 [Gemmatimonadetes bacterium]|nr:hypothetical protein [Gemmatimonadota bacterium]